MTRILLATDGSQASIAAEAAAVDLCVTTDAELVVVHCWRAPGEWLGEPYHREAVARELTAAQATLDRPLRLADAVGIHATAELVEGPAPRGILEVAEERNVDFVVVGTHSGGPLERFFIGSVSHGVLRHAHVPVLVVTEGWVPRADRPSRVEAAAALAGNGQSR